MQKMFLFLIFMALSTRIFSHPVSLFRLTITPRPDGSWLWGWTWGSESTVSIVDRSPVLSFASRPAAFGIDLQDPLLGYVIPLSAFTEPCRSDNVSLSSSPSSSLIAHTPPNLGCPPLCLKGPNEPERGETWIALVQRGECQFVDKVREAQRLGANAVVVGGDDPEISGNPDILVNMYSPDDSSDVTISSTFIKYSDYATLFHLISTSNTTHSGLRTVSLQITTEFSAWEWYSPIVTFIIILVLPSLLTFVTLLAHRLRAARAAQRDRAPEDVVKCLPWKVWTGTGWEKHGEGSGDTELEPRTDTSPAEGDPAPESESCVTNDDDPSTSQNLPPVHPADKPWFECQQECAICLSSFVKGDRVRVLPCLHIFHMEEVDAWLIQRKKLCPVCKADVTQPHATDSTQPTSPSSRAQDNTSNSADVTSTIETHEQHPSTRLPASAAGATERTPLLETQSRDPAQNV